MRVSNNSNAKENSLEEISHNYPFLPGFSRRLPLAGEPPSFDNGFDLENGLIPANEIDQGGPGRDGIPAIDKPRFVARRVGRLRRPRC